MVCTPRDGPLVIFDMVKRNMIRKLTLKEMGTDSYGSDFLITDDGKYVLLLICRAPPGAKDKKNEESYFIIHDIGKGTLSITSDV